MRSIFKKHLTIALITTLFAITAADISSAESPEFSALYQTTGFLSSVVGLDMTKYSLVLPSPPSGYENITSPNRTISNSAEFDGLLEIKAPSYHFESKEGTLDTMSTFYNGHLTFLNINSQDNYTYSDSPPTDSLNQAKTLLQRYQTFVSQKCAIDGAFLTPMQNVLNNVSDLSLTSVTIGNITFQVSIDGNKTRFQWIYTENGIIMNRKRIDISFCNNALVSFRDTWSIYKVSGPSVISSEEATKIALEAAQKVELHVGYANGTSETVKVPDLSNAPYDINFAMVPYRDTENNFPSKIARDPLTLYPYWQFHFYFNKEIGGCIGVQVGIWGDTKEIIYASGYGVLGAQSMSNNQVLEEQKQHDFLDPLVLAAVIIIAVMLTMSISAIVLRHRDKRKC